MRKLGSGVYFDYVMYTNTPFGSSEGLVKTIISPGLCIQIIFGWYDDYKRNGYNEWFSWKQINRSAA
jgi:hypothetical protein